MGSASECIPMIQELAKADSEIDSSLPPVTSPYTVVIGCRCYSMEFCAPLLSILQHCKDIAFVPCYFIIKSGCT